MSDFSHLFCFYPRLPTWSTWVSELRYHISHVSCLLYTCPALFITALSAPGVHCQAGSDSFGLTSAAAVLEGCCTSQFMEQAGPANGNLKATQWRNSEKTGSQSSSEDLELLTPQEDKREFNWHLPWVVSAIDSFRAGKGAVSLLAITPLMTELIKSVSSIWAFLARLGMLLLKGIQQLFTQGTSQTGSEVEKMLFSSRDLLLFLNC